MDTIESTREQPGNREGGFNAEVGGDQVECSSDAAGTASCESGY